MAKFLNFQKKVLSIIKQIPKGKVMSYGQVAFLAGSPRAARQVGQVLKSLNIEDSNIPWWRVLNSQGILSIKGNWTADKHLQRSLLLQEKVLVSDDFKIDLKKYQA